MATLLTNDGKPIECWEVNGNHYFAKSAWTKEEAEEYVRTGKYPDRLLAVTVERGGK